MAGDRTAVGLPSVEISEACAEAKNSLKISPAISDNRRFFTVIRVVLRESRGSPIHGSLEATNMDIVRKTRIARGNAHNQLLFGNGTHFAFLGSSHLIPAKYGSPFCLGGSSFVSPTIPPVFLPPRELSSHL